LVNLNVGTLNGCSSKKKTKERKKSAKKKKGSTTEAAKTSNCNSETSTLFGRVESGKENTRRKATAC
jgi:hypothetical protein